MKVNTMLGLEEPWPHRKIFETDLRNKRMENLCPFCSRGLYPLENMAPCPGGTLHWAAACNDIAHRHICHNTGGMVDLRLH